MRTTIEITEAQRAELLRLSAQRGEKGFSAVIREAVDFYLQAKAGRGAAIREALRLKGVLSDDEAEEMQRAASAARKSWR